MDGRLAKVEASVEHAQRDNSDLRGDMRDVRDRLARLETKVDHLPSKGFIVAVVIGALTVVAALVTFAEKLQGLVG